MEQIVQIKLTPEEDAALKKSAGAVKELTDALSTLNVDYATEQHRPEVLTVHPGDVRDRNLLRAHRLAFPFVRAAAEPFRVMTVDHGHDARGAFHLALRQQREVADLRRGEKRSRRVLAGGDAGAAADARG